jgi:hypothetical protein
LIFSGLGYETIKIDLKKVPDKIFLIPKILELEEVVVSSKKEMNKYAQCGKTKYLNY